MQGRACNAAHKTAVQARRPREESDRATWDPMKTEKSVGGKGPWNSLS